MPNHNEKPAPHCAKHGKMDFSTYCGAYVCAICDNHHNLARCYCGWAADGGNGRQQLIEMGETLEPDDGEGYY